MFIQNQNKQIIGVQWEKKKSIKSIIKSLIGNSFFRQDLPLAVFYHGKTFALIPGVIHDQSFNDLFLYFSNEAIQDGVSFHTSLESNNLQLAGNIPTEIFNQLSIGKQDVQFHHGAVSFLSLALKERFNLLNQEILISIYPDFFYLAAFRDQELVVFNRFDASEEEQILRYIYGIAHKLNFDAKLFRLTIFESQFNSLPKKWGQEYFKNIKFSQAISNQLYLSGAEEFKRTGLLEASWILN